MKGEESLANTISCFEGDHRLPWGAPSRFDGEEETSFGDELGSMHPWELPWARLPPRNQTDLYRVRYGGRGGASDLLQRGKLGLGGSQKAPRELGANVSALTFSLIRFSSSLQASGYRVHATRILPI